MSFHNISRFRLKISLEIYFLDMYSSSIGKDGYLVDGTAKAIFTMFVSYK